MRLEGISESPSKTAKPVARILDPSYRPVLTDNGEYMLRFRYLARTADGAFEEPVEMFRRVAWNLASAERVFSPSIDDAKLLSIAERFFCAMTDFRYLPNAPTLLGAGRPLQQLSACYVLPVEDSVDGIFESLRMAAMVHSKGSGTGFSFSSLRPRGSPIATGGVSTGPVSFMRVFDAETEAIKSGGTGWGANMGVLRCDHPDIREFIRAKSDSRGLQNFNISVAVTDDFMRLAKTGGEQALRDPHTREVVGHVNATALLELIAREAWSTGDPGLLFADRIERDNPTPALGSIEATNPCGEAPLLPFEACWLGGINLGRLFDPVARDLDWAALRETCVVAARMMDNAIEVSKYPLAAIGEATRRTRKVGIGIMGFADLLIQLGIRYGSRESEELAGRIMKTVRELLERESEALAAERGTYPAFEISVHAQRHAAPRRNATVTANAPNSTIAAIAGCSSGIEPLFALSFAKLLANGDRLQVVNPEFVRVMGERGFGSGPLMDRIAGGESIQDDPDVPQDVKDVFVTAHDITVEEHIRVQSAFQRHTELAVAKTINLPHDATVEDVRRAFFLAHEAGCKGITCFRDGCRDRSFLTARVCQTDSNGSASC